MYGKTFFRLVSFFFTTLNNKFFSIYNYLFRFFVFFIRFSMNICASFCLLVGPSGLEPPTSCLSGTRSNLLSYEPMWLVSDFCFHLATPFWKFIWLAFFSKKVTGGDDGIRTHDPLLAGQVLSQLSYTPIKWFVVSSPFFFSIKEAFQLPLLMSALSYLPVRSPAKYFHHCRA